MSPKDEKAAVHRDLEAFARLHDQPHDRLSACRSRLPDLTLTVSDVRRVLTALANGDAAPELVQRWASFVRRGCTASEGGPISPIVIEFDPTAEEAIAEVISRLDEIGDLIDGEIDAEETESMLRALPV